ncbi:hypothetical protein MCAMS1_00747 [biofilm metagenome]
MKKLFLVLVLALSTNAHAVSFNCKKASTLVENVICSDKNLSKLDDTLASSYKDTLKTSINSEKLRNEEAAWLVERNACKDKVCVKLAYEKRINELVNQANSQIYEQKNTTNIPSKVGKCVESKIQSKSTRFEGAVAGDTGGEVNVQFDNSVGLYILDVEGLPKSTNQDKYMYSTSDFAIGDDVKLCLSALPNDCPEGDDRGKVYSVTNHKNNKTFTGVDAWHLCGGA